MNGTQTYAFFLGPSSRAFSIRWRRPKEDSGAGGSFSSTGGMARKSEGNGWARVTVNVAYQRNVYDIYRERCTKVQFKAAGSLTGLPELAVVCRSLAWLCEARDSVQSL